MMHRVELLAREAEHRRSYNTSFGLRFGGFAFFGAFVVEAEKPVTARGRASRENMSGDIQLHVLKNNPAFKLMVRVVTDLDREDVSYCAFVDKTNKSSERWVQLPKSSWKGVSFRETNVLNVEITQKNWNSFTEDLCTLLATIKTKVLKLQFRTRDQARRVLQNICFHLDAELHLDEKSKGIDKKITYTGEVEMLSNDLLSALDWYYTVLSVEYRFRARGTTAPWLENLVKKYMDSGSVRCSCRSDAGYEFEKILPKKVATCTGGPRKINLYDHQFDALPFFTQQGVRIVVENTR
ncbi:unnamed protein product [Heligmosomoides polygyrus]|uniref:rRNA N-glycosidase n=1 Tax=Heligmosomoides polygyrus TaxID=6339 RepID=A0A3P8DMC5_HELPZ|nr:unnamed protein product [Heligmosomoides polygyrus]